VYKFGFDRKFSCLIGIGT